MSETLETWLATPTKKTFFKLSCKWDAKHLIEVTITKTRGACSQLFCL
jgi:hypothetical protein